MASKKTHRVYRKPLNKAMATHLLALPSGSDDHGTIMDRLAWVRAELSLAVDEANKCLGASPLTDLVANDAKQTLGRRGTAQIKVDPDGQVMLEIHYLSEQSIEEPTRGTRNWATGLSPLEVLRKQAIALGIDPHPFGRSRKKLGRAIKEHIEAADPPKGKVKVKVKVKAPPKAKAAAPKVAPPKAKAAPKKAPKAEVKKPDPPPKPEDPFEDDAELDLDALFGPTEAEAKPPEAKPPPPEAKPQAPAKKIKGRSLSQIATDDVDIEAILAKPAPSPPPE